ncbi:polysaccharide biosynthesis/export family protein [Paraburkholderia sp. GAS42]|jgi:polysaccharide export outer membrane protein|uniref:polysaccharide biosynthesis/export family protein n=1 Tax=Paraburkholderia sp. GAS42 TaxID=3035135 RepID=UPI003D1ED2AD
MTIKSRLVALLLFSGFAGCAIAPGPYLDPARMQEEPVDNSQATAYPVHMINAKVVASQVRVSDATNRPLPQQSAKGYEDYKVGPGDILGITVWGHPELTVNAAGPAPLPGGADANPQTLAGGAGSQVDPNGLQVAADGTIYFPVLGRVRVAGMTTASIGRLLMQGLSSYAVKPQLEVRVQQFRSQQVHMAGQVKNPGALPVTDMRLTVVDAITRSGGTLADADLQRVQLTRGGKSYVLDVQRALDRGDITQNVDLRSEDIVYVPDHNASRVFVLGEIGKPQSLFMDRGRLTLADAISGASSLDSRSADPRQVLVIRRSPDDPTRPLIYRLDMTQVDAILLSTQFDLQPLDVVYVGTKEIARLNRLLEQLLPTVTSLYLAYSVGH